MKKLRVYECPICNKKHPNFFRALLCADADYERMMAEGRRLRLISIRQK